MNIVENLRNIKRELPDNVKLVAVSKYKPAEDILTLYQNGQLDFGENYVQEMVEKAGNLPADIRWHFIGHLQRNKVKYIAPFVHLIHSVDSLRLLEEINKQAANNERVISCLLQTYIATEDTKTGMTEEEVLELLHSTRLKDLKNVKVVGLMGMSTFTDDLEVVRKEFKRLKHIFDKVKSHDLQEISMGMSGDWSIAVKEGSTMVRVGSSIFGQRN